MLRQLRVIDAGSVLAMPLRGSSYRRRTSDPPPAPTVGSIVDAGTPAGDQLVRSALRVNRLSNLSYLAMLVVPFFFFPWFYYTRMRHMWIHWRDPYGLPDGFDPNRDAAPPPTSTTASVGGGEGQLPAASQGNAATVASLFTASAPGSFVLPKG